MMLATLLLSADPFLIERIDTPEGVVAEVGGIDVDDQGRVWACFHHGEVCVLEDNTARTLPRDCMILWACWCVKMVRSW